MPTRPLLLLLPFALLACANDASPEPPLEPGTLGRTMAQVRVRVLDARTRAPLAGATVTSDDAVAFTDAQGEVVLPSGDAVGARATGFVAQTFVGAEAAALTLALEPSTPPPTRTVTVELADWSALRATQGDGLVARFSTGRDPRIDRDSPSTATCSGADLTCRVSLEVGEHARHAFAELATVDDAGTPDDPRDDLEVPFGFAIGALIDDGAVLTTVEEVVEVELDLRLPEGIDAIVGVPGLRVDDEVLVLASPTPPRSRFVLPVLEGASFWAIATHTAGTLSSRAVERATPDELRTALAPPSPIVRLEVTRDGDELLLDHEGVLLSLHSHEHVLHVFDRRARVPAAWIPDPIAATATDATPGVNGWNLDEVERRWSRRATRALP